jgi:hypothetical protein
MRKQYEDKVKSMDATPKPQNPNEYAVELLKVIIDFSEMYFAQKD